MIAALCLRYGLHPTAFGVDPSDGVIGAVMVDVGEDWARKEKEAALKARAPWKRGR